MLASIAKREQFRGVYACKDTKFPRKSYNFRGKSIGDTKALREDTPLCQLT